MLCGHAQGRLYRRVRVSLPAQPAGRQRPTRDSGGDVPGADRCRDHRGHRAHAAADAVPDCRFRRRRADPAPTAVRARDGSISRPRRRAVERACAIRADRRSASLCTACALCRPMRCEPCSTSLPASKSIHIHVAEQEREVAAAQQHLGARPIEWLLEHAPRRSALVPGACDASTPAELKAIAATGAVIALCPTTEANLGDGIFPLPHVARGRRHVRDRLRQSHLVVAHRRVALAGVRSATGHQASQCAGRAERSVDRRNALAARLRGGHARERRETSARSRPAVAPTSS